LNVQFVMFKEFCNREGIVLEFSIIKGSRMVSVSIFIIRLERWK
jgi:hypothetical protein